MEKPIKKKRRDPYRNVKYLGYCMSQLPDTYTLKDLVRYARFQLSVKSGRLMKDPIWDEYTIEEILIEFFGHQFTEDKDFRMKFEHQFNQSSGGTVDEFSAWADKQMKDQNKTLGDFKDKVVFDPNDVMGEDEE